MELLLFGCFGWLEILIIASVIFLLIIALAIIALIIYLLFRRKK